MRVDGLGRHSLWLFEQINRDEGEDKNSHHEPAHIFKTQGEGLFFHSKVGLFHHQIIRRAGLAGEVGGAGAGQQDGLVLGFGEIEDREGHGRVHEIGDGVDLLDVASDVRALANLIAATETKPPLSIGLFGDWGSGKSFLIGKVRDRVQDLAARSRRDGAARAQFD